MYEEKSDQDIKERAVARQPHRLRNNVEERDRQHVSGAQRQKILQILARPIPAHHKIPANQISRRRHHPQQRRQPHPKYQIMSHSEVAQSDSRFYFLLRPSSSLKTPLYPQSSRSTF